MKTISFLKYIFVAILLSGLFYACGSQKTNSDENTGIGADTSKPAETVKKIFFSIPSPIQSAVLLKKAGVQYDKKVLNSVAMESKYSTSYKKSVNMGVYCADLAYCNMFDQTQEALNYLNTINRIANTVGMTKVIENLGLSSRFQNNLGNKDSLMMIIAELFRESDEFLKENQQYNTATLVLAGGWVEGLFIASQEAKKNKSKEIRQLIADQKLSLNSLMALLPPTTNELEYTEFKSQLEELKSLFGKMTYKQGEQKAVSDESSKSTTISGGGSIEMTDEVLAEITEKAAKLRSQIVK